MRAVDCSFVHAASSQANSLNKEDGKYTWKLDVPLSERLRGELTQVMEHLVQRRRIIDFQYNVADAKISFTLSSGVPSEVQLDFNRLNIYESPEAEALVLNRILQVLLAKSVLFLSDWDELSGVEIELLLNIISALIPAPRLCGNALYFFQSSSV